MKKIILEEIPQNSIYIKNVDVRITPIFAKMKGKLVGMCVKENNGRWILRIGGEFGATGHRDSLEELIRYSQQHGYEFFVED